MNKQELLDNISQFIDSVETRINAAIVDGKTITGAALVKEISGTFGLTNAHAVAIIAAYVATRSDIKSTKGKGISKRS